MTKIELDSWEKVSSWLDNESNLRIPPSYLDRVNKRKYPLDAFSLGQLASKAWLINQLEQIYLYDLPMEEDPTVAILGCWVGSLVPFLHRILPLERVYGFDMDPSAIELAEEFNREYVVDNWKFKGVVMDLQYQPCNWLQFETGGELIQVKPDWLINTSCEHMDSHWFETADSDQLIIMQSNNSPDFDGHINICNSVEDMQEKYPLSVTNFVGELVTPAYTRFMQIGYK